MSLTKNLFKIAFLSTFFCVRYCKKFMAFTLAEILLTLLIIGIIVSMTIPVLIADVQDQQNKTSWKKIYSELDQATKMAIIDNGGSLKNMFNDSSDIVNLYRNKFSYVKECSASTTSGNCWNTGTGFKHMNGSDGGTRNYPGVILNNGAMLMFLLTKSDCSQDGKTCGWIYVDVNGFKSPNVVGKDIFLADIRANSLIPAGADGDSAGGTAISTCNPSGSGWGCSALYISN